MKSFTDDDAWQYICQRISHWCHGERKMLRKNNWDYSSEERETSCIHLGCTWAFTSLAKWCKDHMVNCRLWMHCFHLFLIIRHSILRANFCPCGTELILSLYPWLDIFIKKSAWWNKSEINVPLLKGPCSQALLPCPYCCFIWGLLLDIWSLKVEC